MRKIERYLIIISIVLISLLCIGAVSAADDIASDDMTATDTGDIDSIDDFIEESDDSSLELSDVDGDSPPTEAIDEDLEDDVAGAEDSSNVLSDDSPKTFTQLKEAINNPVDGVVTLSGTYKYDEVADEALATQGVVVRTNVTINGPATIDGSGLSRIFYLYGSSATLNGLTIINGKGQYGGAILAYGSSPKIENCIFKNNLAIDEEDHYYAYAGAIYYWTTVGASITNCTFEDNIADPDSYGCGGAIYHYGEGLTITDSIFKHNQAFTGGALEDYGSKLTIDKCIFDSNQAISGSSPYYNGEGGAILFNYVMDDNYDPVESNNTIINSVFINNQAGNLAATLKNEAIGTTIKDCIILGPKTLMGNSILSGCDSGTDCEHNWFGHTIDNASTYFSGLPGTWIVMDLNAVESEGNYNVVVSLNKFYTRSTGDISDYVDCGISDVLFNVAATAGSCADTVDIQNGIGTIVYTLYEPEEGTLTVDYNGITKSITLQGLEKPKENATLIVNVDSIQKGQNAVVEVQLIGSDDIGVAGAGLVVNVNGVDHPIITGDDGKYSFEVEGLDVGQYVAVASFAGDNNYNPVTNTTVFNVKGEPVVTVSIEDIKEGEDALIIATLFDGETGLSGVVEVSISGYEDPFIVAVADGVGFLNMEGLTEGTYTYNASSRATDNYAAASTGEKTFVVTKEPKLNVDVSVDGGNIVVKVTDESGKPVDGAKINVTVDGATQEYTTKDGAITIPASSGDHNMSISTGDGNNLIVKVVASGDSGQGNGTPAPVKKIDTAISASHTSIFTYNKLIDKKNDAYILVTLKDANGSPLANKAFKFISQGKVYKYTTDAKGQKKIYMLFANKGTINPVVIFEGDDQYGASFKALAVKIKPQKVKLTVPKKTYKANKKVKKLTATLKNSKGKGIKGKKLVFIVNKKKYTAKTNKKGVATVKVKLSAKKTYKFKVKFAGDNTYKKLTKKSKVKIK